MRWTNLVVVWSVVAGCGDGGSETVSVPLPPVPEIPYAAEPVRPSIEIVEGETLVIPVSYRVVTAERRGELAGGAIGLEASFRTASAEDIVLMGRTEVPIDEITGGTVELALLARQDEEVEGEETLVLRPVEWDWGPERTNRIQVREAEIEVVILDEPPSACSEVVVRVGEPVVVWGDDGVSIYTTEIVIESPLSGSGPVIEWLDPPDFPQENHRAQGYFARTRTLNDWRVESLGEVVRHRMTAQWWNGGREEAPRLELQVCGSADYGRFIRCSPGKCSVHDEGF